MIITVEYIFVHSFTAHLASYFTRDGLIFDTHRWLTAIMWQLSAQGLINRLSLLPQYVPSVFFASLSHACSWQTTWRQQLHGSHEHSKLFALHVFLVWVISFQIAKPGNIELIIMCSSPEYPSLFSDAGNFLRNLRGVDVIAETSVLFTNEAQSFCWEGYGLRLHIPQGALPAGLEECRLVIGVCLSGQFAFPQNTSLVSAVYYLNSEPCCKFSKPVTVEIQHCVKSTHISRLSFVQAKCSQAHLPYEFKAVEEGVFSSFSRYSCMQLTHLFSQLLGVVYNGTLYNSMLVPEAAPLQICASLYYLKKEREVHIVITRGREAVSSEPLCSYWCSLLSHIAFIQVVQREYTDKGATAGPDLPVEFEAETISLQLPPILKDGWKITPLQNQMVGCTLHR